MGKSIAVAISGFVGVVLAAVAGWAIYTSQTNAPSTNPASQNVVNYGTR